MRPHHNPIPRVLRADETLTALTAEAAGIFKALGFRSTSHTNGTRLTVAEWQHIEAQWRAIETIAAHARIACARAITEGTHAR